MAHAYMPSVLIILSYRKIKKEEKNNRVSDDVNLDLISESINITF